MAEGEFWLPSEFLADEFFAEGKGKSSTRGARAYLPTDLGSESMAEVESDEEDYMAGLTRQMAHAFLQDDEDPFLQSRAYPKNQAMSMSRSPQSTLCDFGIWSSSNGGSPNGTSNVSSPPSTPLEQQRDGAWDLLAAAAGQVVQLRLGDQHKLQDHGILGPMAKPIPSNPLLAQQQLQAERFYQLKQQQLMKQQLSAAWGRQMSRAKASGVGYRDPRSSRPLGLPSSAWPPLQQQQPSSGMRAIFLNSPGTRRESVGTGVFLPRRPGNPSEPRKKPACSTVLLPDRVVRALNVNLDDMSGQRRFPGGYVLDHQDTIMPRSDAMLGQQNRAHHHHHRSPQSAAAANHELRLPAEWTY